MAVIKIAKANSTERLDRPKNIPCYFVDVNGRRIAIVHGSLDGAWCAESRQWLKAHEEKGIDEIYCCHPKIMKRVTGDLRIQGSHNNTVRVKSVRRSNDSEDVVVRIWDTGEKA